MSGPTVSISQGRLQGKISKNRLGGEFFSFQGIPYAKPPLGELRFKAPLLPEKWKGVRDATREGDPCLAYDLYTKKIIGSEDCLFLNVYTPSIDPKTKPKPVMFFIHGGGFAYESGNADMYGPENLLTEEVVLVTINYRLGVLGFLIVDDQSLGVPGNAGLKDMVMALKWVKKNISKFGGDPGNVTIFGQSAGGAAVNLLYISPLSQGLFHRAILQSGCALNFWAYATNNSKKLAQLLNISYEDETELIQKLRKVDMHDLVTAQGKFDDNVDIPSETRLIGYTIERQTNEPAFMPRHPWDLMVSGKYNKIPIMIGYTNNEGMLYDVLVKLRLTQLGEERFPNNFEKLVPYELGIEKGTPLHKKVAEEIKQFYTNGEGFSEKNLNKMYKFRSDTSFKRGIQMTIKNYMKGGVSPIYFYIVSVVSSLNIYRNLIETKEPGATHCDELGYLFKTILSPDITPGSLEDISVKRFVKLWTRFAKTGNPNPKKKHASIDVTWEPVTKKALNYLDIGSKLTRGVNPDKDSMKFWDGILKLDSSIKQKY